MVYLDTGFRRYDEFVASSGKLNTKKLNIPLSGGEEQYPLGGNPSVSDGLSATRTGVGSLEKLAAAHLNDDFEGRASLKT